MARAPLPSSPGRPGPRASRGRQALLGGDRLDLLRRRRWSRPRGQEGDADGVRAGLGELESGHLAEEGVRDLEQDAGAVARVGLGAGGAAVFEVAQYGQRLLDQLMAGHTGEGGHEPDATGVVLVTGVVHPLRGRATVHGRPGGGWRGYASALPSSSWHMQCRGTTLALCEISCRLHDGTLLKKRIASFQHADTTESRCAVGHDRTDPCRTTVRGDRREQASLPAALYGSCPVVKDSKPPSNGYLCVACIASHFTAAYPPPSDVRQDVRHTGARGVPVSPGRPGPGYTRSSPGSADGHAEQAPRPYVTPRRPRRAPAGAAR